MFIMEGIPPAEQKYMFFLALLAATQGKKAITAEQNTPQHALLIKNAHKTLTTAQHMKQELAITLELATGIMWYAIKPRIMIIAWGGVREK